MASKKKIVADLQAALSGEKPLSIDLYVEVLADYESELQASLDKDADDCWRRFKIDQLFRLNFDQGSKAGFSRPGC